MTNPEHRLKTFCFATTMQVIGLSVTQQEIMNAFFSNDSSVENFHCYVDANKASAVLLGKMNIPQKAKTAFRTRMNDVDQVLQNKVMGWISGSSDIHSTAAKLVDWIEELAAVMAIGENMKNQILRNYDVSMDIAKMEKKEKEDFIWHIICQSIIAFPNKIQDTVNTSLVKLLPKVNQRVWRNTRFVGRENLLEDIERGFQGNNCVVLHGEHGIGKSEIAWKYACNQKKTVVFVRYAENMMVTLAGIPCTAFKPKQSLEEKYVQMIKILNFYAEDIIVILDNADDIAPDDNQFLDFCSNKFPRLITTRASWMCEIYSSILVSKLGRTEAIQVFRNYAGKDCLATDEEICELLKHLHGNTLELVLISRLMDTSAYTIQKLIDEIKESDTILCVSEINILNSKDDSRKQRTFFKHMENLVSKHILSAEDERICALFSVLSGIGIPRVCQSQFSEIYINHINGLVDKGLLVRRDDVITMHSILRDIFLETIQPDFYSVYPLVKRVFAEETITRGERLQHHISMLRRMWSWGNISTTRGSWNWEEGEVELFLYEAFQQALDYGDRETAKKILNLYSNGRAPRGLRNRRLCKTRVMYMENALKFYLVTIKTIDAKDAVSGFKQGYTYIKLHEKDGERKNSMALYTMVKASYLYYLLGEEKQGKICLVRVFNIAFKPGRVQIHLIEEIIDVLTQYPKIFKGRKNLICKAKGVMDSAKHKQTADNINWLKIELGCARMLAQCLPETKTIMKETICSGLEYGRKHKLEDTPNFKSLQTFQTQMKAHNMNPADYV